MKIALAEALLRRKELMHKVSQLHEIDGRSMFEDVIQRISVNDGLDEVKGRVAKVKMKDLTREYDYYAGHLRRIDAAIQKANWETVIEVEDNAMKAFLEDED